MTRQYNRSLPPAPKRQSMQEKLAERQKKKEQRQAKQAAKQAVAKYTGLQYDYALIEDEAQRELVQQAALEIRRWQRNTIEVGKTLLAIKNVLPYGQFEDWWQTEFGLSERMVQSLLTIARVYGDPANPRRVAGLSDGALYLLAAPSTPEEARAAVEAQIAAGEIPTRAEVKRTIDGYKPPKPPRPKQLPPPSMPQLTGPVAESEPEPDAIDGEYTVMPAELSFAEWLAVMPTDLDLRDHLAILELAKGSATRLRNARPSLYNAVSNAMMPWSQLITAVEKELKR